MRHVNTSSSSLGVVVQHRSDSIAMQGYYVCLIMLDELAYCIYISTASPAEGRVAVDDLPDDVPWQSIGH